MRRETQNVLLVLVGGALIKIVVDGSYLRYVRPWSGPFVLAAGTAIVLLAAAAIVRDVRGRVPEREHPAPSAWFLMLPVLTILLVAPPALGSGAVTGVGAHAATVTTSAATAPLPPGDAPALDVVDFVSRAVSAPDGPLTGRDVTLIGFVVPAAGDGAPRAGDQDLARLVISCCAADASAARVHLADPDGRARAPAGPEDQWFRVRVRYVAGTGTAADAHVPTARVVDAVPVAPPSPVYES